MDPGGDEGVHPVHQYCLRRIFFILVSNKNSILKIGLQNSLSQKSQHLQLKLKILSMNFETVFILTMHFTNKTYLWVSIISQNLTFENSICSILLKHAK